MSRRWRWFLPGHVWCLPFSLGYALFCLVVYRATSWRLHDGILSCVGGTFLRNGVVVTRIWGRPGAQTIGAVQCYASEEMRLRPELRAHETVHIAEAFLCGIVGYVPALMLFAVAGHAVLGLLLAGFCGAALYSVAYGVEFLRYWLTTQSDEAPGWVDDYRRNVFEVYADRVETKVLAMSREERKQIWGVA